MRSQYMPLALCLFLVVCSFYGICFASVETSEKSYNHTSYDEFVVTNSDSGSSQQQKGSSKNSFPIEAQNPSKLIEDKITQNQRDSEFSYNYENLNAGTSSSISKNTTEADTISEANLLFWQGAFYGFFAMLALLNIICFFLFTERIFVYFFGASTAALLLFSLIDGSFSMIGAISDSALPFLKTTALLLFSGIFVVFSSKYLKVNDIAPKLKLVAYGLLCIALSILIGSAIVAEEGLLVLTNLTALITVSLYFVMGTFLFGRKNYAKFYVIASAIPVLFLIDYFIFNQIGSGFLTTEAIHLKTAILVQTIIMTYAIVYRMRALKEETELRQTEMRIFMKRQELMNRKNVERMVQEVYLENLIMQYDLDGLEIKLLQYISEGKENPKIARKLKMSEKDVEELTNELYAKLEIREQIQEDHRMLESQPDYLYN